MKSSTFSQVLPRVIVLLSAVTAVSLAVAAWDINFWPTDSKVYYFDAAIHVPHIKHLSEIHDPYEGVWIPWLHGKEVLILLISVMQRLMNDFDTLRPFLLLFAIGNAVASVLIFFIARKIWDDIAALVCYGIFVSSMWPYLYILFCKHQPLGLMFTLWGVLFLVSASRSRPAVWVYLSGLAMGLALFSSPVSGSYFPFCFAAFLYLQYALFSRSSPGAAVLRFLGHGMLVCTGLMTIFAYVHWPEVLKNFQGYIDYVNISSNFNHFYYNQPALQRWFLSLDLSAERIRGGWEWVTKYFLVVMPVLFPVYLAVGAALMMRAATCRNARLALGILGAVVLSFASPFMAEAATVAQYGGNYFPAILGQVFLLGFAVHEVRSSGLWTRLASKWRRGALVVAGLVFVLHLGVNATILFTDVFPTRMATTYLSRTIKGLRESAPDKRFYTYVTHPHRNNFILFLNPEVSSTFSFVPIKYIVQPQDGYILVPPATGDSIYIAAISDYLDYDEDVFFNELRRKGNIGDYAVASYRTLANSRIWLHEEEILSYRVLIQGHDIIADEDAGRLWLLDGKKYYDDMAKNIPGADFQRLFKGDLRNIGTVSKMFRYRGYTGRLKRNRTLNNLYVRLRKVGNPQDALVAYVYKVDEEQQLWLPFSGKFRSQPLPASEVPFVLNDPVRIPFDPPLQMEEGKYFFQIHRTGPENDDNYYEVYTKKLGMF